MNKMLEIRESITQAIRSGELKPGDQLPIQEEMARQYAAGVATVHSALRPLKVSGAVYTTHRGTFIGPRAKRN